MHPAPLLLCVVSSYFIIGLPLLLLHLVSAGDPKHRRRFDNGDTVALCPCDGSSNEGTTVM